MKIKIISNGSVTGTRVINADTGEVLKDVRFVAWEHKVGEQPTATLEFVGVPIEASVSGELIDITSLEDEYKTYELRRA